MELMNIPGEVSGKSTIYGIEISSVSKIKNNNHIIEH